MPRKFKHIRLPDRFISRSENYDPNRGRLIEPTPQVDYAVLGKKIQKKLSGVKRFSILRQERLVINEEKKRDEIVIKFAGSPNKAFFDKYHIDIFQKKDKHTVYGKISNQKFADQEKSDFERLEEDTKNYTDDNTLKSYFRTIKDIKPLNLNEILDLELKKYYKEHPEQSTYVDLSFSDGGQITNQKLEKLETAYSNKFVSKINSRFVHFCRMKLTFEEIKEVSLQYSGITNIDFAPHFVFEQSSVSDILDQDVEIVEPPTSIDPVFVFDGAVNDHHKLIEKALVSFENSPNPTSKFHATAVASLVVCGAKISPQGRIIQYNKVATVDIAGTSLLKIEEVIKETVEKYQALYPRLLINMSMNDYANQQYKRKPVHILTKLLDELSWEHNCLFFISAGNLFSKHTWLPTMTQLALQQGYPNMFRLPFTDILPPADSINNISVGSIAYQASPNSMARMGNPNPITRKNIKNNFFIKPDFVHYDSNCIVNNSGDLESEGNGIYLAGTADDEVVRDCGTSFATPLVAHEAGLLHNYYPDYSINTLKALLIHTSDQLDGHQITDVSIRKRLLGFGMPNAEKARHSLSNSSTIVIEDEIGVNQKKKIRFPIPDCIKGSSKKRLKIRTTIVYNPPIYPKDLNYYNPLDISARILREDGSAVTGYATRDKLSNAFSKSNVKKYNTEGWSTKKHTGTFWELAVECESIIDDIKKVEGLPTDYKQKYSVILTIEDMFGDESIDLHSEISQMIEVEIPVEVSA